MKKRIIALLGVLLVSCTTVVVTTINTEEPPKTIKEATHVKKIKHG